MSAKQPFEPGRTAILGGTGLDDYPELEAVESRLVATPFGDPSGPILIGQLGRQRVAFLARHGSAHDIPPHRINYRANLWGLRELGVTRILAVAAVGGIDDALRPGQLVFPNQVVDYTWGREHTFFDGSGTGGLARVDHIDFTSPYTEGFRDLLIQSADRLHLDARYYGTYGAAQGPRLESAGEIDRMENDGCDLVGMTGMPEAALARELGIEYACCALVVNAAAGRGGPVITMEEITRNLEVGMSDVKRLVWDLLEHDGPPA